MRRGRYRGVVSRGIIISIGWIGRGIMIVGYGMRRCIRGRDLGGGEDVSGEEVRGSVNLTGSLLFFL